ncbi:MAG: DMT family transporter [Acidimicrobiia bacterium]|nr:DMT family transporter [Acidimicrobiia bacterium]
MKRLPASVLLSAAAAFWGGNFIVGRAVSSSLPPLTLSFYRWLIALIVLLPLAGKEVWAKRSQIRDNAGWFALVTVTGTVLFHVLVYVGLGTTTAINATLLVATSPVIIPVVAVIVHRDRITGMQGAGIATSIVGVLIILTRADLDVLASFAFSSGDLLILAAVVAWAVYSVVLRDRRDDLSPLGFVLAITVLGIPILFVLYLSELAGQGGFDLTLGHILTIVYVGLFASVLAYLAWNKGVELIGAVRAGPYMSLMPVFAALLAVIFPGEFLELFHVVGTGVIALGLILSGRRPVARLPAG